MQRSTLIPLLPMLAGCVITIDDVGDEAETSESESSGSTGETTTSESSSAGDTDDDIGTDDATTDATGSDSTGSDSTGSDSTGSDSTDSGSESGSGTETGGGFEEPPPGYCGMAAGPDEPWVTIDQYDQVLMTESPVELECGGQGTWMFRINFTVGGFQPDDMVVPFTASMDVEGFNIGPNGHFAQVFGGGGNWFLGCCDSLTDEQYYLYGQYCYYDQYITFYPPDAIDDLAVLDGLPATINLTVDTPEGLIEEHLDVTIWAVYEQSWELCLYEYYSPLQPLTLDVPIPSP